METLHNCRNCLCLECDLRKNGCPIQAIECLYTGASCGGSDDLMDVCEHFLPKKGGWFLMKHVLPADNDTVFVFSTHGMNVYIAEYRSEQFFHYKYQIPIMCVTHWKPLVFPDSSSLCFFS